ncbi:unnamed protein product, partial [marine sediment metagenome]
MFAIYLITPTLPLQLQAEQPQPYVKGPTLLTKSSGLPLALHQRTLSYLPGFTPSYAGGEPQLGKNHWHNQEYF